MNKPFLAVFIFCLMFMFACRGSDIKSPLVGKWQAVLPQTGESEKYLSEVIEFYRDGTVSMPDFPGKKLPFKTELSKEERGLLRKNYPNLEGKDILLILLAPAEPDWVKNAAAYQYNVTGNELSLRPVITEKPVKFKRVN
jgi:hypothetical protein